ncbi:LEA type 2 family protein [Halorientalis pallida]|uniref:Water stress and hypersensitive response domain-containing protein n=1 Tax=Halorientalis pallida TaxID=2479928 RepID=A0A498L2Z9_9EURY|nr:LEA type 2 family protein [Halorientalis pallida]RXK49254.1 hypothetical protein EAF64_10055 [Halorientalis pallida]
MLGTDGDERGLGAAGKLLLAVAIVLIVAVPVAVAGFETDLLGVPDVTAVDNRFAGATESVTVVTSDVTVRNPNPVTVAVDRVDVHHTVYANGVRLGGGVREELALPAGNSTVHVRTAVRTDRVTDWWVRHVRRGERSNLTVVASVSSASLDREYSRTVLTRTVRTDVLAAFETDRSVPVDANVSLISGPVLTVDCTTARWGAVGENRTVVAVAATVSNPTAFDVPLRSVSYDVRMNGRAVANGSTVNATTIPAGATGNVTARLVVDNDDFEEWWPTHIERNQTTRVRIDPTIRVDLSRFGRGSRTFTPSPITRRLETDLFGGRFEVARDGSV